MLRILLHVSGMLLFVFLFWLLVLTGVLALFVLLVVLVLRPCRFCILAGQLLMVSEHVLEASLRRAACQPSLIGKAGSREH